MQNLFIILNDNGDQLCQFEQLQWTGGFGHFFTRDEVDAILAHLSNQKLITIQIGHVIP